MNKVKAIKVLKPLVDSYVDYANISMKEEDDDIVDALEMAIEALKALDVPDMNVGDMIIRQAAIDRINKQREHLQPDIYPQDKIGDATYRICAEFIARLPSAQPEPHWIPCSERLPEKNCRCLTTNKAWGSFEVDWNAWIDGRWLYPNEKPIAWMPLPKAYQGGDAE